MRLRDLYSPGAQVTRPDQPLAEAARSMITNHVGSLVVVAGDAPGRRPVGILTDRDIVRGQLRRSADLFCLTVGDVMTRDPLTIGVDAGLTEAIQALQRRGVRRAPVIDAAGDAVGVITLDDILPALARELGDLATLIGGQAHREHTLVA